jgi:hypothetical protein
MRRVAALHVLASLPDACAAFRAAVDQVIRSAVDTGIGIASGN